MPGNAQTIPFQQSQSRFAERKVQDGLSLLGKSLPASVVSIQGALVTCKFELNSIYTLPQVQVPLPYPEWIRFPVQPGTKGVLLSADAWIGAMCGLGSGTADLSPLANLSNLVFVPLTNTQWSATDDPNAVVIYGPNGVVARNADGGGKLVVDATHVELSFGEHSVTIDADGVKIDGSLFVFHRHSGVTSGSDNTGVVVP